MSKIPNHILSFKQRRTILELRKLNAVLCLTHWILSSALLWWVSFSDVSLPAVSADHLSHLISSASGCLVVSGLWCSFNTVWFAPPSFHIFFVGLLQLISQDLHYLVAKTGTRSAGQHLKQGPFGLLVCYLFWWFQMWIDRCVKVSSSFQPYSDADFDCCVKVSYFYLPHG